MFKRAYAVVVAVGMGSLIAGALTPAAYAQERVFELRIYTAQPGKFEAIDIPADIRTRLEGTIA